VLSQSPPPNANGVAVPKISLLVAAPPSPPAYVMPSFIGQPLGNAAKALQDGGMHLGVVTLSGGPGSPFSPPLISNLQASSSSTVVSQTPAAGEKVVAGTAVNFQVK